ncbi:putative Misacylated tRNA(Ala) deacylase [Giardia muris]|uniref:Putative Misacylated tRNA(Ala) deacylase n=1 Tax=Giardia muris TaxID=5742 RepID=A0A4Z1SW50_GIAMU|nr:putative Misacylated tRNA(Ala) deacylase [Giardia muris]|eukprot:TNJ30004.1 putative Misacylated tRNA(Ala) deacylase [Giardia muris]
MFHYLEEVTTFKAIVMGINKLEEGKYEVDLDKTYFFPQSGGQLGDKGSIINIPVTSTLKANSGRIIHILETEMDLPFREGDEVEATIDKHYRLLNSQTHTGQHILSRVALQLYGADTSSFTMGSEISVLELSIKLTSEQLLEVERKANLLALEGRNVISTIATCLDDMQKYPKELQKDGLSYPLRILEIDNFDICLCCGTHVSNTNQCGLIKILSTENVSRGLKLQFAVGERALDAVNHKLIILTKATSTLSVNENKVVESIQGLQEEIRTLKAREKVLVKTILPVINSQYKEVIHGGVSFHVYPLHDFLPLKQDEVTRITKEYKSPNMIILFKLPQNASILNIYAQNIDIVEPLIERLQELVPGTIGRGKTTLSIKYPKPLGTKDAKIVTDLLLTTS